MGRPLDVSELRRVYAHAVPHVQAFMVWALGTEARPEAVLELHSREVNFEDGFIYLNPPAREQVRKKYRPVVRLPDALWETFEGWAVSYGGEPVKSIKNGLWRPCDRAGGEAVRAIFIPPYGGAVDAQERDAALGGCGPTGA
jgi:hypothetical protein